MLDQLVEKALTSDIGTHLGELWMTRNLLALVAPDPATISEALASPDGGRPAAAAEFDHCLTETEQAAFVDLAAHLLRAHVKRTAAKLTRTARLLGADVDLDPRLVALVSAFALPWPARPAGADPEHGLP